MKKYEHQLPLRSVADQRKDWLKRRKSYCKKDLVTMYGITYKTLAAWLRPMASEIGPLHGYYFTIAQLEIIFDTLGYPGE